MSRALFVAALLCATPAAAQTLYFSEIGDVPLAAGFVERDAAIGFTSDNGRLALAEAEGAGAAEQVRAFYMESLPALGWSFSPGGVREMVFVRGRERLALTIVEESGRTRISVRLAVRPASMNAD